MELWSLGNEIMFRLNPFMSFILCMEITNKWLIAPLYTELTQIKVAFGTFHNRPPPFIRLLAGATITQTKFTCTHLFHNMDIYVLYSWPYKRCLLYIHWFHLNTFPNMTCTHLYHNMDIYVLYSCTYKRCLYCTQLIVSNQLSAIPTTGQYQCPLWGRRWMLI